MKGYIVLLKNNNINGGIINININSGIPLESGIMGDFFLLRAPPP